MQSALDALDSTKKWRVTIEPYRKRRSLEQNSYLHAVPLKMISDATGYEVDDLKMYFMGKAFGFEEYEIMGEKRKRPVMGTSDLNTEQFSFFMEWLQQWAAQELDLVIPSPREEI